MKQRVIYTEPPPICIVAHNTRTEEAVYRVLKVLAGRDTSFIVGYMPELASKRRKAKNTDYVFENTDLRSDSNEIMLPGSETIGNLIAAYQERVIMRGHSGGIRNAFFVGVPKTIAEARWLTKWPKGSVRVIYFDRGNDDDTPTSLSDRHIIEGVRHFSSHGGLVINMNGNISLSVVMMSIILHADIKSYTETWLRRCENQQDKACQIIEAYSDPHFRPLQPTHEGSSHTTLSPVCA